MSREAGPLVPLTSGQVRALWTIAKRRGWGKAELYAALGVESMHALSVGQAAGHIERLSLPEHQRGEYIPPPPDRARCRGAIRNATARQRSHIALLFEQLGWSADKARGWLEKRHGIRDLAGGVFSSAAAVEVTVQLKAALRKGAGSKLDSDDSEDQEAPVESEGPEAASSGD